MAGLLEMFDPNRHTPRDVGLGGVSTEYLMTSQDEGGKWFNFPSIYWDEKGNPVNLSDNERRAKALALRIEKMKGGVLPRYDTMEEAVAAARARSSGGGGLLGSLLQGVGP